MFEILGVRETWHYCWEPGDVVQVRDVDAQVRMNFESRGKPP